MVPSEMTGGREELRAREKYLMSETISKPTLINNSYINDCYHIKPLKVIKVYEIYLYYFSLATGSNGDYRRHPIPWKNKCFMILFLANAEKI